MNSLETETEMKRGWPGKLLDKVRRLMSSLKIFSNNAGTEDVC